MRPSNPLVRMAGRFWETTKKRELNAPQNSPLNPRLLAEHHV
jgi:hypothetical protein